MTITSILGIAAISLAIVLLIWSLFGDPDRGRRLAVSNLHRGIHAAETPRPQLAGDDGEAGRFRQFARRLTPRASLRRLDMLLARAGRPRGWPLNRVVAVKILLAAVGLSVGALIVLDSLTLLRLLAALALPVALYFLPDLLVYNAGLKRREVVQLELADTLDQMVIAVEAGLGFEAAMAHAGRTGTGPLAEELVRTLQDIQVGQPRRDAYEALATRNDVKDLRRFISAIIQADVYGVAIGDVLRTQAAEMRLKRRQRAEKKAMEIPVKIVLPLVLCILPVLFIVVMGPAAINIAGMFGNM